MTADVVVLADWRRDGARARATAARHPCVAVAADAEPLHRGRQLVVIGTGTVAHAVRFETWVPAGCPAGDRHGPHTAYVTYCGRGCRAEQTTPRTGDAPRPCSRCTTRLLRLLREGY